eukprot:8948055-Pyramimonas_sp.AAC.1
MPGRPVALNPVVSSVSSEKMSSLAARRHSASVCAVSTCTPQPCCLAQRASHLCDSAEASEDIAA